MRQWTIDAFASASFKGDLAYVAQKQPGRDGVPAEDARARPVLLRGRAVSVMQSLLRREAI